MDMTIKLMRAVAKDLEKADESWYRMLAAVSRLAYNIRTAEDAWETSVQLGRDYTCAVLDGFEVPLSACFLAVKSKL
jgi:hypothetical protein